jgi:hypothetical protein
MGQPTFVFGRGSQIGRLRKLRNPSGATPGAINDITAAGGFRSFLIFGNGLERHPGRQLLFAAAIGGGRLSYWVKRSAFSTRKVEKMHYK